MNQKKLEVVSIIEGNRRRDITSSQTAQIGAFSQLIRPNAPENQHPEDHRAIFKPLNSHVQPPKITFTHPEINHNVNEPVHHFQRGISGEQISNTAYFSNYIAPISNVNAPSNYMKQTDDLRYTFSQPPQHENSTFLDASNYRPIPPEYFKGASNAPNSSFTYSTSINKTYIPTHVYNQIPIPEHNSEHMEFVDEREEQSFEDERDIFLREYNKLYQHFQDQQLHEAELQRQIDSYKQKLNDLQLKIPPTQGKQRTARIDMKALSSSIIQKYSTASLNVLSSRANDFNFKLDALFKRYEPELTKMVVTESISIKRV